MEGFLLRFREESINEGVEGVCRRCRVCVCVRMQVCLQGGVGDCVCKRWSVCIRASCICGGCTYACETLRSKFLKFSRAQTVSRAFTCFSLCCVHMEIWSDVYMSTMHTSFL